MPDRLDAICGNTGGFIGYINSTAAANVSIGYCTASGDVTARNGEAAFYHAGGFAGLCYLPSAFIFHCSSTGNVDAYAGVGGFVGRMDGGGRVEECTSYGNVYGGWVTGGFAGTLFDSTVKNCTAYGDTLIKGAWDMSRRGGFVGAAESATRDSSFENCTAYGVLDGFYNLGGFAGTSNVVAGRTLTFKNCKAYGSVIGADNYENAGGFIAWTEGAGNTVYQNCKAYGNVSTYNRAGGFVAVTSTGKYSYTDCGAYGDVEVRGDPGLGGEAGGFAGWVRGVTGDFLRCEAAGSVKNSAAVNTNSDAGGFIGVLSLMATIDSCRASAASVIGTPNYTGTFIGAYNKAGLEGNPDGSVIKNCTYREYGGLPMVGGNYGDMTIVVSDTENNTANNTPIAGVVPALTATVTKAAANNDIDVSFANLQNISGYVTDLSVSVDGGRSYTQFIYTSEDKAYDGYVLTPIAGIQIGGKLPAQAFTLTVKNAGAFDKGKVVVKITFSDGYACVVRGANL